MELSDSINFEHIDDTYQRTKRRFRPGSFFVCGYSRSVNLIVGWVKQPFVPRTGKAFRRAETPVRAEAMTIVDGCIRMVGWEMLKTDWTLREWQARDAS